MGAGSSALILLVLVISGFLFNQIYYRLRYFSARAEGQKLFFMAAGAGIVIGALVFGATGALKVSSVLQDSWVQALARSIDTAIPVPYACRLITTIVFAVVAGLLMNLATRLRHWREWSTPSRKLVYNKLTDEHGNAMSQLLRRAAVNQKLVMLTLQSRKIYCGRILEVPPNIEREDACVELLPFFSGYRDKDTLRLGRERTEYPVIALWEARQYLFSLEELLRDFERRVERMGAVTDPDVEAKRTELAAEMEQARKELARFGDVSKLDVNEWNKVIPIKEIETASFYDPDSYKEWFTPENEGSSV